MAHNMRLLYTITVKIAAFRRKSYFFGNMPQKLPEKRRKNGEWNGRVRSLSLKDVHGLTQRIGAAGVAGEDDVGDAREAAVLRGLPGGDAGTDLAQYGGPVQPQGLDRHIAGGDPPLADHKRGRYGQVAYQMVYGLADLHAAGQSLLLGVVGQREQLAVGVAHGGLAAANDLLLQSHAALHLGLKGPVSLKDQIGVELDAHCAVRGQQALQLLGGLLRRVKFL